MFSENVRGVFFALAIFLPGTVGVGSTIAAESGCTPQDAKTVRDVLTVTQLACVIASQFTDAEVVMQACQIEERLRPAIMPLLAQKAQAQKMANCRQEQDAGADAGGE